ncbi:MAG: BlaI/MecI/CopY family transcriptional regulator [Syntrophomonas sp.]|uniref:BlaI/MecI/CopY family transcriptional regulator n=1 Tax=Syntrophomonas sp. TaxID=2053627 RepID=UPI00260F8535|nr:BlaI/MecI/CopY family transcriptional regulator [Syntrophomonas sp.]MDD2511310.1 BlaI/MecI/CopY family transcriptional regulator [Syntrophomonas sp.]MDD4627158.1 BlaI/MecI/CopY family transcriptional regulator [Syntrophomonas sp.]
MEHIKRLPDSELELMMIIWEAGQPVSSAYIMDKLAGEKHWANTTVLNFLARLVDRGFLAINKQGRVNYYTSLINEQDYLNKESKSFLKRMHMGSLKNFVAALYDGDAISNEDLAELKQFVEEIADKNKEG